LKISFRFYDGLISSLFHLVFHFATAPNQGCQMVYFHTKILLWVNFGEPWKRKLFGHLEYITAIWYILWPFGNLVAIWYIFPRFGNLLAIWYIFPRFGILCHAKSGNPAPNHQ
jgi:hypothetical protein